MKAWSSTPHEKIHNLLLFSSDRRAQVYASVNNRRLCVYQDTLDIIHDGNLAQRLYHSVAKGYMGFELVNDPCFAKLTKDQHEDIRSALETQLIAEHLLEDVAVAYVSSCVVNVMVSTTLINKYEERCPWIIVEPLLLKTELWHWRLNQYVGSKLPEDIQCIVVSCLVSDP